MRGIAKTGIFVGMFCPPAAEMIFPGIVKEGLPPVIKRLLAWRKRNNLSRRGAVEVMKARGVEVSIRTLERWEQGLNEPGSGFTQLLSTFLKQHPVIPDPPHYPPGPPPGSRDHR
jgi:hypothetical protein